MDDDTGTVSGRLFQVRGIRENVHGSMVDDGKEDLNSFDLS